MIFNELFIVKTVQTNQDQLKKAELIEKYTPLVQIIAHSLHQSAKLKIDKEDLQQIGFVGLLKAAERFDPALKTPFASFARLRIRGEMIDSLSRHTGVSRRQARKLTRLNAANEYMESMNDTFAGRDSEKDDIDFISMTIRGVSGAMSLSELQDIPAAKEEFHSPEKVMEARNEARKILEKLIVYLKPQEANIIRLHYFQGKNLSEIARQSKVSRSWVSRLHTRGLDQLLKTAQKQDLNFHETLELLEY